MQRIKITTPNNTYYTEVNDARVFICSLFDTWNRNTLKSLTWIIHRTVSDADTWLDDWAIGEGFDYDVILSRWGFSLNNSSGNEIYEAKGGGPAPFTTPPKIVTFLYEKDLSNDKRRLIEVQKEDSRYIRGLDLDDGNKYKCFIKSKIVGKVKEVN